MTQTPINSTIPHPATITYVDKNGEVIDKLVFGMDTKNIKKREEANPTDLH